MIIINVMTSIFGNPADKNPAYYPKNGQSPKLIDKKKSLI